MTEPIKLLIVDDHKMVREGLKAFVVPVENLEVIGEATNGREAVERAACLKPDVILMDLVMPELDGIGATKQICSRNPDARILMITSFADDERVMAAIQAGALGYLLKDSSPRELEEAIQAVFQGESYLPPRIAAKVIRKLHQADLPKEAEPNLTGREKEIVMRVAEGLTNDEIAKELFISAWTVRSHMGRIMRKLDVENRTQVALFALRSGLVTGSPTV
jgi:NarL family two-component system response regulator LiaR